MNATLANPLIDLHSQAEAELQAYDQMEIVSTFGEPQAEYAAIRKTCGLMDLPQRGILEFTGADRHTFLNNLISNDTWSKTSKIGMEAGKVVYAFFLNLRGRIVADINVIELGDKLYLETDARLVPVLQKSFDLYLFVEKVKMTSRVGELHEMVLHGPSALELLCEVSGSPMALESMRSTTARLWETGVTVWRDDVCGVPGLHLIVPILQAKSIWMNLIAKYAAELEPGKRRLRPVGWAAFNATRIEAGRPLFDIDMPGSAPDRPGLKLRGEEIETEAAQPPTAGILPLETGLMERGVSLSKCYVGQEIVARMVARKAYSRQIVGIRFAGDELPIAGAPVQDEQGNTIGTVTSSTVSPVLSGIAICLGIVKKPFFTEGTKVSVPAEGAMRQGTVVKLPFLA